MEKDISIDSISKTFYFSEGYYSSLDFIYKYAKEVLIDELSGVGKKFFKKIFTNLEDHRFARLANIENESLYNNVFPMLGISVNQDFSGPGNRTRMDMSHRLHIFNPELSMPTIFADKNISIQLGSNIYKYNISMTAKFESAFIASNFISRIYNTIHVNKHYYPEYSILKYKIDIQLYKLLRDIYRRELPSDEDFLRYLNNHSRFTFIREFDKASGNVNYFVLLNVRPLAMVQSPSQMDSNVNGLRESSVALNVDLEIELPNTIYINTPSFLLRDVSVHTYEGVILKDSNDPEISKENKEVDKDKKIPISPDTPKLVTMPKIDNKRIEEVHKKDLQYTGTISISNLTDTFTIEDKIIIKYLSDKDKEYILKIFDEDGKEVIPRKVSKYDDGIDITLDMYVEETILVINIYG